jgi:hypothetical protein
VVLIICNVMIELRLFYTPAFEVYHMLVIAKVYSTPSGLVIFISVTSLFSAYLLVLYSWYVTRIVNYVSCLTPLQGDSVFESASRVQRMEENMCWSISW